MGGIPCPRVRLDDGSPAANIDRREVVCKPRVPTDHTAKECLRGTIGLIGVPAGGALPRGVAWVDEDYRYSGPFGLVQDLLGQVMKRPAVQRGPLGLPKPYPFADAPEVFQGNAAPGALSLSHDALADAVVDVACKAMFLTRDSFVCYLISPPQPS